jgi:hypothetical protein
LVIVVSFASYTFGSYLLNEVVANFTVDGVNKGVDAFLSEKPSFQAINWNPLYRLLLFNSLTEYVWDGTLFLLALYSQVLYAII